MNFKDFGLIEPIMQAIKEAGYETPTAIQSSAIPPALKGRDILGCAQTGTGKTVAFAFPIIQKLVSEDMGNSPKKIRTLILTPTRELAIQIRDTFRIFGKYTPLKCSVVLGGVNLSQAINT